MIHVDWFILLVAAVTSFFLTAVAYHWRGQTVQERRDPLLNARKIKLSKIPSPAVLQTVVDKVGLSKVDGESGCVLERYVMIRVDEVDQENITLYIDGERFDNRRRQFADDDYLRKLGLR